MAQGILGAISPAQQGQSTQQVSLGTRYEDAFGRVFHYGEAASAVGRGYMALTALQDANDENLSFQTAPAVGDKIVKVTLGGSALTADEYKDGWFVVQDGTGEGRAYKIEGNDAQTSTSGTGVIYLAEEIDTAGATGEANVDLVHNRYDDLRVDSDQNQTDTPAGVPICVGGLGASEFGYVQTWGPCAVWRDAAETLGNQLTLGATTGTGQVEAFDAVGEPIIGLGGPVEGVAGEEQLMYLMLDR